MLNQITYQNNKCYLCNCSDLEVVDGIIRDRPELKNLRCKKCGLIFLNNFKHINEKYYEESNMLSESSLSIEKWEKQNFKQNKDRASNLMSLLIDKIVLDFGCGEGGFLKNIKPFVKACAGVEKCKKLREHIVTDFKIQTFPNIDEIRGENFDVITMFHIIEHLKDPIKVLKKLKTHLSKTGIIYIETPNSNDALLNLYNCKAFQEFTYWSCHLMLFSTETLKTIAKKAGFNSIMIKQIQRYPLSNHLYWLIKGEPDGHNKWNLLNNRKLNSSYEQTLTNLGIADTLVAIIS